jgi:hypothetical protein
MDTFEGKVYTINTSLNERTIYIKIIDTIQYLNYEGNIELKEFRMPITLQDAYLLVTNCFSETKDHSVSFSKNTNVLRLDFKAKVGGYMNIGFEFILRETAIGGDAKASMQMIEMERKHKKEMCEIMERLDRMEKDFDTKIDSLEENYNSKIIILEKNNELRDNILILDNQPINSHQVNIGTHNLKKFPLFYNCKKVTIQCEGINQLNDFKNDSVECVKLHSSFRLKDYNGLQNMPKLTHIEIHFHNNEYNLNELVNFLSSYIHNIKYITLSCEQYRFQQPIVVPTELQTYCKKNNIDLIVQ